ncbi:Ig-like domain-containing protein [Candidatus Formimonas warabiya]|uniref:Uncharacterized protein n=1 Tax=Formimonas warabiya TaxID=1761012 RepID=A0A3G1KQR4_FORW1|nr:Ig-like domain-containing protein [Candidatus Formimonas warabiya]ATW24777.1 hypothetical protein DCMF_08330 [Candidatus Formimonas warabiya]
MGKRRIKGLWAAVLLSGLLFSLSGLFSAASLALGETCRITSVKINDTPVSAKGAMVDFPYVRTLTYSIQAGLERAGYDSYRAQLSITDPKGDTSAFGKTAAEDSVAFSPYTFSANQSYNIQIQLFGKTGDVETLADTYSFSLNLGVYDADAPRITDRSPVPGASGVGIGSESQPTPVMVTFDEAFDPATVTSGCLSLSLSGAPGAAVPSAVTAGADNKSVTLKPNGALAYYTKYQVTLQGGEIKDKAGNAVSGASWEFTTAADPARRPAIERRSPEADAEDVPIDSVIKITIDKPLGTEEISYASNGPFILKQGQNLVPARLTKVADNGDGKGELTITPNSVLGYSTIYTVIVRNVNDAGGLPVSPDIWTFTTEASPFALVKKHNPEVDQRNIPVGICPTITFSRSMSSSTINSSNIYLTERGETSKISATVTYSQSAKTATIKPSSELDYETEYQVHVTEKVKDSDGKPVEYYSFLFETGDSGTAKVTDRSPGVNTKGVALDAKITFEFDREMYASSVNNKNIYLRRADNSADVDCSVDYDTDTRLVTIKPDEDLKVVTEYTVFISDSVEDSDRLEITPVQWNFTTVDNDTLRIVSRSPAADSTDISSGSKITVEFSMRLDESTVTESTLYLRKAGAGTDIKAAVSLGDSEKKVTITPASPLEINTEYTVYVTSGVKSKANLSFTATNWKFKTKNETITANNIQPASNAAGVKLDSVIGCSFSGALKADTVNNTNIYLKKSTGDVTIPAKVNYNSSANSVTLVPDAPLEYGTNYIVYVTQEVKSTNEASVKATSWSFTTETKPMIGTADRPLVRINGTYITFTDAFPYITNERTMIPFRALFESMKATIDYQPAEKKVTAKLNENTVVLVIGQSTGYRNNQSISLEAPPVSVKGRTMIPLRFAGESLGGNVQFDQSTYTVVITTP